MALLTEHTLIQIQLNKSFAVQPSRSNIILSLVANTFVDLDFATDLADVNGKLPTFINFSSLGDIYVGWNQTGITVPSTSILDGTAPEINPGLRAVAGKTSLSIVSATNCNVQLALFVGE